MSFRRSIASIFASLAFAGSAAADPTTITFEVFPGADGILGTADDVAAPNDFLTPLRDQFASMGMVFQQGTLLQSEFFDGDPHNHYLSSTNPIATFSVPVFGLSIQSRSYWDATLTAYDARGTVVAIDRLLNPDSESPLFGTLSVMSAVPIASFSILPPDPNQILNLDNMVLTISPVPAPSQFAFLAGGLLLLSGRYLARSGRSRSIPAPSRPSP